MRTVRRGGVRPGGQAERTKHPRSRETVLVLAIQPLGRAGSELRSRGRGEGQGQGKAMASL